MKTRLKEVLLKSVSLKTFNKHLINRIKGDEKHIFIACLPKSGSTFLADVLVGITGFDFIQFQPIRGTNEHNLDTSVFFESLNKNTVTQLHSKPNECNKLYFKQHKIKVVFLFRDVRSSLKSFYNHLLNENNKWFMFTVAKDFEKWEVAKQFDFLIDLVIPWYINFLTSWALEINKGDLDILEVDYDDFKSNNEKTINEILTFYNLEDFVKNVKPALDKSYSKKETLRYNNKENKINYEFTLEQIRKIEKLVSYYPELNIKI